MTYNLNAETDHQSENGGQTVNKKNSEISGILAAIAEAKTNGKKAILKENRDDSLLKRVLKMTYDTVTFGYGIGKTLLGRMQYSPNGTIDLSQGLDVLEQKLSSRAVTGGEAYTLLEQTLGKLSIGDADILRKVVERDLRLSLGSTTINGIWPGLIPKPAYNGCEVFSKKTAKGISFPAYLQLKANGEYIEIIVKDQSVSGRTRSGEPAEYPNIFEEMRTYPDGVYAGELTIIGEPDRSVANGLLNSDNPPHDRIIVSLWDYITVGDYDLALAKDRKKPCRVKYDERFSKLESIVGSGNGMFVNLIESIEVGDIKEAKLKTSEWIKAGLEGSVLKCKSGVFMNGKSPKQLKMKLEFAVEMRCVGFEPGTVGTSREGKVGSIMFSNDEGTVKGRCSGFSETMMNDITDRQDFYIGKILEVQCNDLSKSPKNDYYALGHPRFISWRFDKDETDTFERVKLIRDSATELDDMGV